MKTNENALPHLRSSAPICGSPLMNAKIENNFRYHPLRPNQAEMYEALRAKAKELAYLIEGLCPPGREKSTAFTQLESAVMWANAAIARNENALPHQRSSASICGSPS